MHSPGDVNASGSDESVDDPVSEGLDSCTERSFLSQRQCRLIYQQLRKSDACLEESFAALVHGSGSDGRLCVLEVFAARDSPLTNTVRQRLHDLSMASPDEGQHWRIWNWCDQAMLCFPLPCLILAYQSQMYDVATQRQLVGSCC